MVKAVGDFFRSQFSESDGTVSNTRVCIWLVVVFALGWVTALVSKIHGTVTVSDLGQVLGPLGMFVTGISGSLYAINKTADVFNNRTAANKPPGQ